MGKTVDEVILEMTMPKGVLNVSLTASQGKYSFEPTSKLLMWNVGKIEVTLRLEDVLQHLFEFFFSYQHRIRYECELSGEGPWSNQRMRRLLREIQTSV